MRESLETFLPASYPTVVGSPCDRFVCRSDWYHLIPYPKPDRVLSGSLIWVHPTAARGERDYAAQTYASPVGAGAVTVWRTLPLYAKS